MCRLIRDGHFGFEDYFQSLCDSVEGDDFYLLSSDFGSYLEAQVIILVFMGVSKYTSWCYITQYVHGNMGYRLLLIKHFRIRRSGLKWASLAQPAPGDLAVIEQSATMLKRVGELNPADSLLSLTASSSSPKVPLVATISLISDFNQ